MVLRLLKTLLRMSMVCHCQCQFGFQQNCSTDYAILQLTKEIYESLEKKEFTLGVFVDRSKAFDTVDHDILIKKLSYFGIKNKHLKDTVTL